MFGGFIVGLVVVVFIDLFGRLICVWVLFDLLTWLCRFGLFLVGFVLFRALI